MEYTQMPKFCWADYNKGLTDPEFKIPRSCGIGMNHYCIGLLELQRSKKAKTPTQRKSFLMSAQSNTLYTLGYLKRNGTTATCPIADHVAATMRDIEIRLKTYGIK